MSRRTTDARTGAFSRPAWSWVLVTALVAAGVAFAVPWVTFGAAPNDTSPWWVLGIPLCLWGTAGAAAVGCVLTSRRLRRIGMAVVVGDAAGALLFIFLFAWALSSASIGWD